MKYSLNIQRVAGDLRVESNSQSDGTNLIFITLGVIFVAFVLFINYNITKGKKDRDREITNKRKNETKNR